MFATITSFMAAGRFGVMPTANAGAVTSARTVLNFDPMVLGHSGVTPPNCDAAMRSEPVHKASTPL